MSGAVYGQHNQHCTGCDYSFVNSGNLRTTFVKVRTPVFSEVPSPVFRPRFNARVTYAPHVQYRTGAYRVRHYLPRTYFPRPQAYFYSDFYQGLP